MSSPRRVRVGVLGAGAWARSAHLPGFARDSRCEIVAIADTNRALADEAAAQFGIPLVFDSPEALIAHDGLDLIDVCTPSSTHFELSWAALESGRHVLCEKPVAFDYRDTRRAAELARSKRLKTKLGFTFRYAPAVRYMRQLVADGFVGTPFIFNGYEQNSQWLDPMNPLRQVDPDADPNILHVSSLEGYGAPIIDISHLLVGSDLTQVIGTMRNFIPNRMVRATGMMQRMNIDDGDIYMGEFANGALCSIQTSYVTVGNYPESKPASTAARGRSSAGWSRRMGSASGSGWPPRTRSSSSGSRCRSASIRRAGRPASCGARSSTPISSAASSARSCPTTTPTKVISTTARGCRRRSTPWSGRTGSADG